MIASFLIFLGVLSVLFVLAAPGAEERPDDQFIGATVASIAFGVAYYCATIGV